MPGLSYFRCIMSLSVDAELIALVEAGRDRANSGANILSSGIFRILCKAQKGVECGEGCLLPTRRGLGRVPCSSPFFYFLVQNGPFLLKNFFALRQKGVLPGASPKYATDS